MNKRTRCSLLAIAVSASCAWAPTMAADKIALIIKPTENHNIPSVHSAIRYYGASLANSDTCSYELGGRSLILPNCFELPTVDRVATIEQGLTARQEADRHVVLKLVSELESRIRELESEVEKLRELDQARGLKAD